jgi:hypothetical protein
VLPPPVRRSQGLPDCRRVAGEGGAADVEGVVDHQTDDIIVRDAGLGKGLGAGDAEDARGGDSFVTPAEAGVQGSAKTLAALDSRCRGNDGQG